MNGLMLDRHAEEQAVELFATNILKAGEAFLEGGEESAFIPTWQRVSSLVPDVFANLVECVSQDQQESTLHQASSIANKRIVEAEPG